MIGSLIRKLTLAMALALAFSQAAFSQGTQNEKKASKEADKQEAEKSSSVIEVQLPQSSIRSDVVEPESLDRLGSSVELKFSSWNPDTLMIPSRVGNASAFSRSGFPLTQLDFNFPSFWIGPKGSIGALNLVTGVGFMEMSRTATDPVSGTLQLDQNLYFIPFKLGAQFVPTFTRLEGFEVFLAASLDPSLALTNSTAIDDGKVLFALPIEAGAGARYRFSWIGVELGAGWIIGSLEGGSLSGFGFSGGVILPL
jgi:hypothetical protein